MFPIKLDLAQTLAFAAGVLYLGHLMRRLVPILGRYNLPAPVLGGLLVSILVLVARQKDVTLFEFDMKLRLPLQNAFFTSIGFGASLALLKKGGRQVLLFLLIAVVAAVLQNVVGAATAVATNQPPLFGVLCGSVTLTGGPATGLAFAPEFEKAGLAGAEAVALAAAMGGIIIGGIIGGPIGTFLIERLHRQRAAPGTAAPAVTSAADIVEAQLPGPVESVPAGEDVSSYVLLKSIGVILIAMWIGTWIANWVEVLNSMIDYEIDVFGKMVKVQIILPSYIGAMIAAAVIRNLDDVTGWIGLSQSSIDELGNVALAFFLALSLMTLELWKLAAVALPLLVVLLAQLALIALLCFWPVFPRMGRDYDAAVMAGGFCGFMMGTTANAMANMDALVRRYGPAPRAFLVVPMVGALFIDFFNALLIIPTFLGLLG
jgi:ESS family glutamate:Na+ symporter